MGPAKILWRTRHRAPQKVGFLWRTLAGAPQKVGFLWRMGKICATESEKFLWRTMLHAPQKYFCGAPLNGASQNSNLSITLFLVVTYTIMEVVRRKSAGGGARGHHAIGGRGPHLGRTDIW